MQLSEGGGADGGAGGDDEKQRCKRANSTLGWRCKDKALDGGVYCEKHLIWHRKRAAKLRMSRLRNSSPGAVFSGDQNSGTVPHGDGVVQAGGSTEVRRMQKRKNEAGLGSENLNVELKKRNLGKSVDRNASVEGITLNEEDDQGGLEGFEDNKKNAVIDETGENLLQSFDAFCGNGSGGVKVVSKDEGGRTHLEASANGGVAIQSVINVNGVVRPEGSKNKKKTVASDELGVRLLPSDVYSSGTGDGSVVIETKDDDKLNILVEGHENSFVSQPTNILCKKRGRPKGSKNKKKPVLGDRSGDMLPSDGHCGGVTIENKHDLEPLILENSEIGVVVNQISVCNVTREGIRRGRGRPKGSKNKKKTVLGDESGKLLLLDSQCDGNEGGGMTVEKKDECESVTGVTGEDGGVLIINKKDGHECESVGVEKKDECESVIVVTGEDGGVLNGYGDGIMTKKDGHEWPNDLSSKKVFAITDKIIKQKKMAIGNAEDDGTKGDVAGIEVGNGAIKWKNGHELPKTKKCGRGRGQPKGSKPRRNLAAEISWRKIVNENLSQKNGQGRSKSSKKRLQLIATGEGTNCGLSLAEPDCVQEWHQASPTPAIVFGTSAYSVEDRLGENGQRNGLPSPRISVRTNFSFPQA